MAEARSLHGCGRAADAQTVPGACRYRVSSLSHYRVWRGSMQPGCGLLRWNSVSGPSLCSPVFFWISQSTLKRAGFIGWQLRACFLACASPSLVSDGHDLLQDIVHAGSGLGPGHAAQGWELPPRVWVGATGRDVHEWQGQMDA